MSRTARQPAAVLGNKENLVTLATNEKLMQNRR